LKKEEKMTEERKEAEEQTIRSLTDVETELPVKDVDGTIFYIPVIFTNN